MLQERRVELKTYIFCMAEVNVPIYHILYETQAADEGCVNEKPVGAGPICKAYVIILCRHLYVSSENVGTLLILINPNEEVRVSEASLFLAASGNHLPEFST